MADWYWKDGSAYCPPCVHAATPAIDEGDAVKAHATAGIRCACCGASAPYSDGLTEDDIAAIADDREASEFEDEGHAAYGQED